MLPQIIIQLMLRLLPSPITLFKSVNLLHHHREPLKAQVTAKKNPTANIKAVIIEKIVGMSGPDHRIRETISLRKFLTLLLSLSLIHPEIILDTVANLEIVGHVHTNESLREIDLRLVIQA